MPGMNSGVLMDTLKTVRPRLKCLFMSGYSADVMTHNEALEAGRQFLQKPFLRGDLLSHVREVLTGSPGQDRAAEGTVRRP